MAVEFPMTLEQAILDVVRALPPDKQEEVLNHAQHLREQIMQARRPRRVGRGLWANLNIDLSAEEIDEARREMWKNFPRDDF
jgi:siroheme synthase (precorrin-2 oxidase/ferrochelatase)